MIESLGPRSRHATGQPNRLRARRLGINTLHEAIVFMRTDCHVCRSEGFTAHSRIRLANGKNSTIATLYQVTTDLLADGEAGLSDSAWQQLGLSEGDTISVSHPRPLSSLGNVRGKVYGKRLSQEATTEIIEDIVARRYSDIQLSSFITACSSRPLDQDEVVALTTAMVEAGDRLSWNGRPVADKHCVGGLPGNRTTPIVVAIATARGLTMPKTSSRAITSPAGTADTMETLAPVDLDVAAMRKVVECEGGCVIWGGSVRLSPADDILIRVERALDLDSEGQLVASVLSKKIAAGASHVVLDVPVGPTAKVRSEASADSLNLRLSKVAASFGLHSRILVTDGRQPIGRGIGPALEAKDVLAVLQRLPDAPQDLRDRAVLIAGALLELTGFEPDGTGQAVAAEILQTGKAWEKFQRICEAQGGMRQPPSSIHVRPVLAPSSGRVTAIDNRRLAQVAKLAGAPDAKAAGVELHIRLGAAVQAEQPLYTVHTETPGELAYAIDYVAANADIVRLSEP